MNPYHYLQFLAGCAMIIWPTMAILITVKAWADEFVDMIVMSLLATVLLLLACTGGYILWHL